MPQSLRMLNSCVILSAFVTVDGHGSLVIPQVRNAIDRHAPQWKGGYPKVPDFPGTGRWGDPRKENCGTKPWACQEGCSCSNGTSACDVGQSCFWFSSGCTIGCDKCDGDGSRPPNSCRCRQCANATLNDPKYRTGNNKAVPGSPQDITKYNPWRAPGLAPSFDPCGMAGGGPKAGPESGEYNTTEYAKQGDLGSNLPESHHGTIWKAGDLATTGWYIRANHGGGYQYRLCPKSEPLTEECFRKTPLKFEGPQTLRWKDGSEENITGTYVSGDSVPDGSMWARNPLPVTPTPEFPAPCKSGASPPVRAPKAEGEYGTDPGHCAGAWPTSVIIMDKVRVPADLPLGEYVLGWRWDCELTAQVWAACADITIESSIPSPPVFVV
eukprot:gnl/MRDRNA2_/MRDRNA2_17129_c0_seq1.p1 gnl/MRDRNA2_/MRDRNA2_17129_c0~~gnl/MRDRNA2_/MRDRNA2_17129_c0_seq1.p1  ORF type:complete len:399 (+),score=55.23 gnl/MRDRNA2_/MRDRNA2_17129_c0_seq1:54-1199(+)